MHIIDRTLVLKILYLMCSCIFLVKLSDFDQTIRNFTELCSLSWVWVLAKKYRTIRYKFGLSDTSDYLKFLRTSLSVLNCFFSSWVILKSDYPMWSEYPMTQRLRNSMELESLWEDKILASKIMEYPIRHRTIRSIGLSKILQNFVLSLACLGVKNIGLSDVTSESPRWDEKILSQQPHFGGIYKYPPPNPFLGLPNSFIHIHFGLSLVLRCFGSLSSLSLSQITLCSLCSGSWWLWIWCLRA